GGRIIDGMGNPAVHADVAIKGGRIVRVGRISGSADQVLMAEGRIVAPGFIDVHTHGEQVDELPLAENFTRTGVTTIIVGNCGSSVLKVGVFLRRLEITNVAVNVATLIGHGDVREKAMGGSFNRPPSAAELKEMKRLVTRAMEEGALGLSTGLIYLPGTFSETEELIELAKCVAEHGGIYTTHMRDEGTEIFSALDEVFRIARGAGLRAHVSHIKLSGKPNWGRADAVLAAIGRARAEGLDITQDQYLYTASSTTLAQLVPEEARAGGKLAERLADPAQKQRIVAAMREKLERGQRGDYAYVTLAECRRDSGLNGLTVPLAAKRTRGTDALTDQIELVLELVAQGGTTAVFHGISEEDLRTFLRHPNTMIASDSALRRFGEGQPHPRGYGNAARLLSRYVREMGVLRLEDAVRRLTGLPASTFGLADRGVLREGAWADVVIFDPARVRDNATFAAPHQYATGFDWVLVNGVAVVRADAHTGARSGQALRGGRAGKTSSP
ncbi:MAG TPA: D-aminoacylase, partial [Candidatus Sulfotelmatobacter sp.]|nr:D-aminoacylase [Candidatus Sulfotelmatobacter sp.]